MTRKERTTTLCGAVLLVTGLALSLLSTAWVEETIGAEPDGGSGLLELLLALVPAAAGLWLLGTVALSRLRRRAVSRAGGH